MGNLNVGIVGTGRMGLTHMSIINSNPLVDIVAISDSSKIISIFFKKYFDSIKLFTDYNELISNGRLNAVIVSTPPYLHYDVIKTAINNRIHVFAEKPFTLSYEESSELANLAEGNEIVNQVGYVNRFNDMFIKVKELISTKVIGDIIIFKSEMFSFTISRKNHESEGWRSSEESGGGCLNEMASHAIDLVNYIIGVPDAVSGSVLNKVYSKNVDDIVSSTLIYDNGITGTLYVNWCNPSYRKPSNKLEIFGMEGKILVDQHDLKIFERTE